jgi:hypothetical protein
MPEAGRLEVDVLISAGVEAGRLILSSAAIFGLENCWQWKPLLDGKQVRLVEGSLCISLFASFLAHNGSF